VARCESEKVSDLSTRESRRTEPAGEKPVPVLVAALTTSIWAAVVGSAPVVAVALVAWIAETRSGAPAYDAVRVAFNGWLLAHGAWLRTDTGPIGLAPLALSILVFRQLMRAGINSARATGAATIGGGAWAVLAISTVYGLVGGGVAVLADTAGVHADLPVAFVAAAVFAAVATSAGVLQVNGIGTLVAHRLPLPLARALPSGALAACVVLGAGALLAGLCLAFAADDATMFFGAFSPGVVGSSALFGLSVLYTPTAAIWGAAYVVGPGFAVGSGTSVSAVDVSLGTMPAFPLLAGLPVERPATWAGVLLGVPLLAGVLAGVTAARRRLPGERWASTLLGAALAGPVAGGLLGVAAYAAGGPLGSGRLAAVGPSPWRVALVSAVEVTLFAVVGAASARILATRPDRSSAAADGDPEVAVDPGAGEESVVADEPAGDVPGADGTAGDGAGDGGGPVGAGDGRADAGGSPGEPIAGAEPAMVVEPVPDGEPAQSVEPGADTKSTMAVETEAAPMSPAQRRPAEPLTGPLGAPLHGRPVADD